MTSPCSMTNDQSLLRAVLSLMAEGRRH